MDVVLTILVIVVLLAGLLFAASARVVKQIERGVVFRLGRVLPDVRQPGLTALIPVVAVVQVQDYAYAIAQVAQTSLRSIIGKSELDDLLCNREHLNEGLEIMLDSPAVP